MKINDIFEFYGENYFRELEQNLILDILDKKRKNCHFLRRWKFFKYQNP